MLNLTNDTLAAVGVVGLSMAIFGLVLALQRLSTRLRILELGEVKVIHERRVPMAEVTFHGAGAPLANTTPAVVHATPDLSRPGAESPSSPSAKTPEPHVEPQAEAQAGHGAPGAAAEEGEFAFAVPAPAMAPTQALAVAGQVAAEISEGIAWQVRCGGVTFFAVRTTGTNANLMVGDRTPLKSLAPRMSEAQHLDVKALLEGNHYSSVAAAVAIAGPTITWIWRGGKATVIPDERETLKVASKNGTPIWPFQ